jgi:hypothetical protein
VDQVTYDLAIANFPSPPASVCGGPDFIGSSTINITWTDTLGASATVVGVRVLLNWNENCDSAMGDPMTLNGTSVGSIRNPASCSCGGGGIIPGGADLSSTTSYVVAGSNTLNIAPSAHGGYEGFKANSSGSLGSVTVLYAP